MFEPVDYEMFAGKVAGLMQRRIDQDVARQAGASVIGSPEINGLATAREAKAMIDGQRAAQSNTATPERPDLRLDAAADQGCASQMPVVMSNATVPEDVSSKGERPRASCDAAVAMIRIPSEDDSGVVRTFSTRASSIRRWAAIALRSLTGKELAWIAAAASLLCSIWLSMQLHMLGQMNRAVDVLEQLGARIAVSRTTGASVRFEPDRRPEGLDELHRVPDLRRLELAHTRDERGSRDKWEAGRSRRA
ncbi:MAG: hypothetical protein WD894_11825 [Pirellulales bacterium]